VAAESVERFDLQNIFRFLLGLKSSELWSDIPDVNLPFLGPGSYKRPGVGHMGTDLKTGRV
jgi:hypothetical protein